MTLEDIKKQVKSALKSITTLDSTDRIKAVEFLNDCIKKYGLHVGTRVNELIDSENDDVAGNLEFENDFPVQSSPKDLSQSAPEARKTMSEQNAVINIGNDLLEVVSNEPKSKRMKNGNVEMVLEKKVTVKNKNSTSKKIWKFNVLQCPECHFVYENKPALLGHFKGHIKHSMSCRICKHNFLNVYHFWRHFKTGKCKVVEFKCPQCEEVFQFRRHYLRHMLGHNDNNCLYCEAKFSTWIMYKNHLKLKHPDVKLERDLIPCKFCPLSFMRHTTLYNHYRTKHSKGKFVCLSCGLSLSTKEKLKEHALRHEAEKTWTCAICSMKFYRRQQMLIHVSIHEQGQYSCNTCNVSLTSKTDVMKHKKEGHDVKGLTPKLNCPTCKTWFSTAANLETHMASHNSEQAYYCKPCDKYFTSQRLLMKHMRRKTHVEKVEVVVPESKYEKVYEDSFVCERCGSQYKTQGELRCHLRVHKVVYTCDQCSKTFSLKANLTRHCKKLHSNVQRTFICEVCGDRCGQLAALQDHYKLKHSTVSTAKCNICSRVFKRNSELNRHMRTHDQVRKYVCFCGQAYKQSAHLKSHERVAHGKVKKTEEFIERRPPSKPSYVSGEHGTLLCLEDPVYDMQLPGEQMAFQDQQLVHPELHQLDLHRLPPPELHALPSEPLHRFHEQLEDLPESVHGMRRLVDDGLSSQVQYVSAEYEPNGMEVQCEEDLNFIHPTLDLDCTFFTRKEILRVHKRYREMSPDTVPRSMTGDEAVTIRVPMDLVLKLPELRENPFRRRICQVFSQENKGNLSFEDFLDLLSVFSEQAPRDIKVFYAFKIFDFDEDQHIGAEDMEQALRLLTRNELSVEEIQQVIEKVIEECDVDGDGKLSFMEFEHVITRAPEFVSTFHIRM